MNRLYRKITRDGHFSRKLIHFCLDTKVNRLYRKITTYGRFSIKSINFCWIKK